MAADFTLGMPGGMACPTSGALVAAGTRPHRIITPSDSLSCMRAAGTLCVAATLKRVENVHQGLLTLSSCSTSSLSGMTIRSHMHRAYVPGERFGTVISVRHGHPVLVQRALRPRRPNSLAPLSVPVGPT